jgi:hypothetical protein
VVDLTGVGENLQDHPVVGVAFEVKPDVELEASSIYTIGDELEDYLVTVSELKSLGQENLTGTETFDLRQRLGTF